ncbi:hypothetical protein B0T17DRAFT_506782 [Bombardia bombarda]|uniref:Uncharacterized protein n=1 Tax=Bombardia bombarda TaxID=252184 RepID=A0AA39XAF1_9PEZI|nr:hypothetical protein B0T17DRAFT_506782 [Bombardia bombarda]
MHEVYANAQLTISSLTAQDSRDSLFQPCEYRWSHPVPLGICLPKPCRPAWKDGEVQHIAAYPSTLSGLSEERTKGPVHLRGWVLPEQMLSTRILYLAGAGGILYWECLSDCLTEVDPCSKLPMYWYVKQAIERRRVAKGAIKGVSCW